MSRNRNIGAKGEDLARSFLQEQGYSLLEKNWRTGHKEIDIICKQGEDFIFVEVKTRTSLKQGMPEESISTKKITAVTEAAQVYLQNKTYRDVRFDVISVHLKVDGDFEILHIKDAFY